MQRITHILITTKHRAVWYAQVPEGTDLTPTTLTNLKNCRLAIRWHTTGGFQELAHVGPNSNTRVGNPADIAVVHDITSVTLVTPEAAEKWITHKNQ